MKSNRHMPWWEHEAGGLRSEGVRGGDPKILTLWFAPPLGASPLATVQEPEDPSSPNAGFSGSASCINLANRRLRL